MTLGEFFEDIIETSVPIQNWYLGGKSYIAVKYNSNRYGVLDKDTNLPVSNMKGIAREYLKKFNIPVSTDPKICNICKDIKLLMEYC